MLCPAELLARIQFLFVSVTPVVENPPNVRRRMLYPAELRRQSIITEMNAAYYLTVFLYKCQPILPLKTAKNVNGKFEKQKYCKQRENVL